MSQDASVLEIIERRLIPNEEAKKARGEVFTPLNLVRELLYGIKKSAAEGGEIKVWGVDENNNIIDDDESDRIGGIPLEVWRNPNTKWLDPANGIGNFPFVAFHMLDYQLSKHGPSKYRTNAARRRKHIVHKMLYMIEIDRGNVNTSLKIFEQLAPGVQPNVCCADTIKMTDDDLIREFGVNRFDVVMGNPPFNTPRETKGQTGILWDKFIVSFLGRLVPTGALVFITPQVWRKPDHKLYSLMTRDHQLYYLRIMGEKETLREFHVGSRVDLYILLAARSDSSVSTIIDERGDVTSVDTSKLPFLPNYAIGEIDTIITNVDDGIRVIHDRSLYGHDKRNVSKTLTERFKFPVMNSMTQAGNGFLYADEDRGHFGVPKVILSVNRNQYPYNDYDGRYGLSDSVFGIPITSKREGDLIVQAINTERFKEIIKATKWSTHQTDHRMFKYFRPDFYKEFLPRPPGARKKTARKAGTRTGTRRIVHG